MKKIAPILPLLLLVFLINALPSLAFAQTPLADFFKHPQIGTASLSPNGKYLATTTNIKGLLQLAVVDMETGKANAIAGYDKVDIYQIRWINDERIVFNVIDKGDEQNSSYSGLYAINRDGSKSTVIKEMPSFSQYSYKKDPLNPDRQPYHLEMVGTLTDFPNGIIALGYFYNGDIIPYRVDSVQGSKREIHFNAPGLATGFVFDKKNQLRVVVSATTATHSNFVVWYRDAVGQEWRKLSEYERFKPDFTVLSFDNDDTTMYVSSATSKNRKSIFKYDFVKNKVGDLVAVDPDNDAEVGSDVGLVFSPDTKKLLGVRMQTEPPKTRWIEKDYDALQASLDRSMPNLVNVIYPGNAQAASMIYSYSSTHPGKYSVYYPEKKKMQSLFERTPWIDTKMMSEKLVFDYKARDGLDIMSYLTVPKEGPKKALPMIVLPHGGPWARDYWGFDPEVQFLASLGYVVLQPQFRGSTGFGYEHFAKGFKQWGLAMQDDVTDGVTNLIKQGLVDPKRVCIMGSSYGGYAAMMGLIKNPELYQCGINVMGVTSLKYLFTETWYDSYSSIYGKNAMIGDLDAMKAQFIATSPLSQAEKIQSPVMMVYGEKDRRVPLIHGEEMRDVLKKHNKTYEWMELADEEHGIANEENRYKVYGAVEKFLKKYNPAGVIK